MTGRFVTVPAVWKVFQKVINVVHPSSDSFGHEALPMPVLREKVSPEVGYEEAHLHTYW